MVIVRRIESSNDAHENSDTILQASNFKSPFLVNLKKRTKLTLHYVMHSQLINFKKYKISKQDISALINFKKYKVNKTFRCSQLLWHLELQVAR